MQIMKQKKILENPVYMKNNEYPVFVLGAEESRLGILTVREITDYVNAAPVPKTPPYIKGVINLRGEVIPVIDLRLKFEMEESRRITGQTCNLTKFSTSIKSAE